jgi:hypothetical protein
MKTRTTDSETKAAMVELEKVREAWFELAFALARKPQPIVRPLAIH